MTWTPCARTASAPTSCSSSPAPSRCSPALSRAWYARAPLPQVGDVAIGQVNGPLDGFFEALKRWVTDASGKTG